MDEKKDLEYKIKQEIRKGNLAKSEAKKSIGYATAGLAISTLPIINLAMGYTANAVFFGTVGAAWYMSATFNWPRKYRLAKQKQSEHESLKNLYSKKLSKIKNEEISNNKR